MKETYRCRHCYGQIFWSDISCCYLHWDTSQPSCFLIAEPTQ